MRSRVEILKDLVLLQGNIDTLERELSNFGWDSEVPFYSISNEEFTSVLKRSLNGDIDFETLIEWANAVECRDDLEFENEEIQEMYFELANPEINGDITKERLQEIINALQKQSPQ